MPRPRDPHPFSIDGPEITRMKHGRDRRYPPSPYRGDRGATLAYRDGWDAGWLAAKHKGMVGAVKAWLAAGGWFNDQPRQRGFEDGARAYAQRVRAEEIRDAQRRAEIEQLPPLPVLELEEGTPMALLLHWMNGTRPEPPEEPY